MFGSRGSKVFEGLAMVLAVLSLLWAGILATGTKGELCVPALMLAGVSICCRGVGSFQKNSRGLAFGFVLLFAVGVYVTWRIYSSQVTLLARYDWYLLCLLFAGLFFGRFVFDSDRRATIVVLALVCLGLGNFVAAIWQLKVDPEWIPLSLMGFTRPLGGGGISGFYVLHNHLAGYLELVAPLVLAIAVTAVETAFILPSHSYFQSRVHISAAAVTVFTVIAAVRIPATVSAILVTETFTPRL